MDDSFWLTEAQTERIAPFFPLSHGIARVDDRRVLSGIIQVIRTGMRWRDAPAVYGPHKRSTTASSGGAGSVSSTASSPPWRARPANLIG